MKTTGLFTTGQRSACFFSTSSFLLPKIFPYKCVYSRDGHIHLFHHQRELLDHPSKIFLSTLFRAFLLFPAHFQPAVDEQRGLLWLFDELINKTRVWWFAELTCHSLPTNSQFPEPLNLRKWCSSCRSVMEHEKCRSSNEAVS